MNKKFTKLLVTLALAAIVTLGAAGAVLPTTFAIGADPAAGTSEAATATVTTATVSTTYTAGQRFNRKVKFVNNEASVYLSQTTVTDQNGPLIFGFFPAENVPTASTGDTNKGLSLAIFWPGCGALYNNVGWSELIGLDGSVNVLPYTDANPTKVTLKRVTDSENEYHYEIYYTYTGGTETLWKSTKGLSYTFTDSDVMTDDGYTYFGANVFSEGRTLTIYENKTTVTGVSFVNGTGAEVIEAYDGENGTGNAFSVSASSLVEGGYEFTTEKSCATKSVKLRNAYGKETVVDLASATVEFAADAVGTTTYEFTKTFTDGGDKWFASNHGGLINVTNDNLELTFGVQGNGGNFGVFFAPTTGEASILGIPTNGLCIFFSNANGGYLYPEIYTNNEGNGWYQVTNTAAEVLNVSGRKDLKIALKKVDGVWGIYFNDTLWSFTSKADGSAINPLNECFPNAEWMSGGKTNFGITGWAGEHAITFYVPSVSVKTTVTDAYGADETYAEMTAAYDGDGNEVAVISGDIISGGVNYVSYNADRIAKLKFVSAGGVESEFNVDYANKSADETLTIGSTDDSYDKTVVVTDRNGEAVTGATLKIYANEREITSYIKVVESSNGIYTIKGVNKTVTVEAVKGTANGETVLDGDENEITIYNEYSVEVTLVSGAGARLTGMAGALTVSHGDETDDVVVTENGNGVYTISGLYEWSDDEVKTLSFNRTGYDTATATITSASETVNLTAIRVYSKTVSLVYTYGLPETVVSIADAVNDLKVYGSDNELLDGFTVAYENGTYIVSGIREVSADSVTIKFEKEGYQTRTASVNYDTADVNMVTKRVYSAVVSVLDEDGNAIENATLIAGADTLTYDGESKTYVLAGQTDVVEVIVTAEGYATRTITLDPENGNKTVNMVSTTALGEAIEAAKAAKQAAVVSADGSDVEPDKKWTTQAALDALNAAIETAETAFADADESATKESLAEAEAALDEAVAAFNDALAYGTKVADKTALEAAVAAAESAKQDVTVSADGSDVEPDKKWAAQTAFDTLNAAIESAKAIKDKANATQAEIDEAKTALEAAVAAFNAEVKDGTKTAEIKTGGCGSAVTAISGMFSAIAACFVVLFVKRK